MGLPVSTNASFTQPTTKTMGLDSSRQNTLRRHASLSRQDSVRSGYVSDRERGYVSDQQGPARPGTQPPAPPAAHQRITRQISSESADSKLCYLTSSEMSDDDRMSLTTAVSDEDEEAAEASLHASPYRVSRSGSSAASFNCTGAVRKAGFLSVKKWLLRKKHQVELARKRGWKGYWVCLKGTTLLFYPCESREGRSIEQAPKHLIIVDGAIMQSIPEHPKREHIFCLSTAFGDAYLFQAPCQVELENWINSIHSACAAAFARHRGKTGTLHLLQEDIFRLERSIESDSKLKYMADVQLSVVSEQDREELTSQLASYDDSLERLHCEQFRLRCYMASLQGGELPNPKGLLTHVSRVTKMTLNRLGVFNVSSFHAYICARSPSLLNNLLAGRGATKRRAPMLSRSGSGGGSRSFSHESGDERTYRVRMPDNQYVVIHLREGMTVEDFLISASLKKNLNPMEQFVRVKKRRDMEATNYFVPHHSDLIDTYLQTHEVCEICTKVLFQVELSRSAQDQMWGFSVEAELIENVDRQDELCCYISRVEDRSRAAHNGLIRGDEIMVINGAIVSDLDMMYLESVLQEELALCLMMRSSRTEVPDVANLMKSTDDIIERLVCPPPPSENTVRDDDIDNMIVPSVKSWGRQRSADIEGCPPPPSDTSDRSNVSSVEIENLLKSATLVTGYCRSPAESARGPSPTSSVASSQSQTATPNRHLSDADKLRKVLTELIDTERTYVKHLNSLIDNYLEPLRRESFITPAEINALFGNIPEIVEFQRDFLQSLEEAVEMEPSLGRLETPTQFKNVLFSIGNAFLYHTNSFKLYSSFCASHSRAQKVLHPSEGNQQLQQFLQRQNPRQQHSSTLESYLIKPIQRILKYPLLLQQLRNLADRQSGEHHHLEEALKGMEKVAEHINEMQRIHEEYGAIFDHLFRQHQKSTKMVLPVASPVDLSPGDLLYYGGVEWLNIADFLGKIKKGLELHAMCFVFKTAVVFLCKERLRQKKKLMSAPSKGNPAEVEIIRYQVLIPVTEVQVRASSCRDVENHYLWELIHLKSQIHRRNEKVYHLSNSTSDFRNAFLKTIRQIIRESVRNMSIPVTKASNSTYKTGTLQPSRTLSMRKKMQSKGQRYSAGMSATIDYDNLDGYHEAVSGSETNLRRRSRTMDASSGHPGPRPGLRPGRPGALGDDGSDVRDDTSRSDVEEEEEALTRRCGQLGRIPNHLSLSTSSTLSAGSTGSQARLIQASNAPEHYQPPHARAAGSPVWKPRGPLLHEARTLPPCSRERVIFDDHPAYAPRPHPAATGARSKTDSLRLAGKHE
ncbi:protein still life, isoform SIF type 1-like isoform X1 [Amphibalanus amphitrite]|uniref:protein still life, isoform SIF type 1-like isoform X4 n=2 Tax=Amphibalanus amphitrite TaxID=1232801 RepID=UPI001C8FD051|nr:protein still life, isoform SIF type 1-like isoform X4 [Amphibalanus amphitrite]XP_043214575.1 protein still life, isoform SIF type 1-like isoform X1 [Amphibalanus amphitrite]